MIESTRSKVIEKSVQLEELISLLLCNLLDIEKKKSISFGTTTFALSFNSKINLLYDMEFLPKELKENLTLFAEIRNKFAHVLYVDNFTKCFEVIEGQRKDNSRRNQLLKKRKKVNYEENNIEVELSTCFDLLCIETDLLIKFSSQLIHIKKVEDLNKTSVVEVLRRIIETDDVIFSNKLIDWFKLRLEEIMPDEEFILKYNEESGKI